MNMRVIIACLAASAALCAISGTASAQIFVTNFDSGTVGEYTTSGAPINPALISGLFIPSGIAVSGDKVFVKTDDLVSEYTTSGALVNRSLLSDVGGSGNIAVSAENLFVVRDHPNSDSDSVVGKYTAAGATIDPMLIDPRRGSIPDIAVSGDKLFLALPNADAIAEYTTSGALVNPNLISGLHSPGGIAISGDRLFVSTIVGDFPHFLGTVGEYTLSGAPVNPALITGLDNPIDIAVSGDKLFVLHYGVDFEGIPGTIGEYTTSGETINAALISGLDPRPQNIAVVSASVPDASSTWTLMILALVPMIGVSFWLTRGPTVLETSEMASTLDSKGKTI